MMNTEEANMWASFPGWLIDNCEGEVISEEFLQGQVAALIEARKRGEYKLMDEATQGEAAQQSEESPQRQLPEITISRQLFEELTEAAIELKGEGYWDSKPFRDKYSAKFDSLSATVEAAVKIRDATATP